MSTDEIGPRRFRAVGKSASVHVICERYNAGDIPVCPVCGEDLVVAYKWVDAREFDAHPGIFCPVDGSHFEVLFNVT